MMDQDILDKFDDIILASGSGGTAADIAIANYLTGSELKVHAVMIAEDKWLCYNHLKKNLSLLGIHDVKPSDIIDVMDDYVGGKYGVTNQKDIAMIADVGEATGIILDPVYTGKAFKGLTTELKIRRERFKGNRILFVHTGGMFLNYKCKKQLDICFEKLYVKE